ncbi:hypothetical protein [Amycolatopsis sp. H20-H5]|uniref:hypothetical protein n=1 Tax=Amycolatopsis sp. H20-H5 TaxID=3046309 RepID=UPI002DBB11C6|nr:hypothetical protein [Amycolatopsis sp. H20-H5]MEC3976966.1 hypothetical protein [Amycolatopsis sp. H20-H5]
MSAIPSYPHDIFTDQALLNPHEHYRALRELGPVVRLDAHQMYVLPRYAHVRAALGDAAVFCSGHGVGLNEMINKAGRGTTLTSDGEPQHPNHHRHLPRRDFVRRGDADLERHPRSRAGRHRAVGPLG